LGQDAGQRTSGGQTFREAIGACIGVSAVAVVLMIAAALYAARKRHTRASDKCAVGGGDTDFDDAGCDHDDGFTYNPARDSALRSYRGSALSQGRSSRASALSERLSSADVDV
jgi:hypothetical protein